MVASYSSRILSFMQISKFFRSLQSFEMKSDLKICRDPDDDKFINCAIDAKAIYIVSGDNDLLTINVAKQMFLENERGSIKTGKFADFLLVDKDVLDCPEKEIHEAKPAATYFEGKKVFST